MNTAQTISDIQQIQEFVNKPISEVIKSLQSLLKKDTKIKEINVKIMDPIEYVNEFENPEDTYVVSVLRLTNQTSGTLFLIFTSEDASKIAKLVTNFYETTLTEELSNLEVSAIKEIANIIFGALLTSLSLQINTDLTYSIPDYTKDMIRAILDQFCAEIINRKDNALAITTIFEVPSENIKGKIILLFDENSFMKAETIHE